ncbi:hypothetical protein COLO4_28810 [Corchorus olitorius]|uniref:Bulb-type lectin domain-containing protein n=1 Tax=Corchorus olitorius TaxID=93759 RepID=A0A1R3HI56_9ROSI|nr:hypothetical protein COLO4_28810 [Corchorus olitorius]
MTAKIIDYQLEYQSFADVPNAWRNTPISPLYIYEANSMRPILINGKFCAGFHCGFVGDGCLFAVSIFKGGVDLFAKQIVWSANRNNPVKAGALLQLTAANLSLVDGSGALVWSPNTQGKSVTVSRLNLSAEGNLMLFDKANNLLWQSFDHPTDSLVVGQRLGKGHKLQSSVSTSNSSDGFHTLSPSPDDDRRKQEEGQLQDLVDKGSDDMQSNVAEVVEMMKVAAWCLQSEYTRRPNMSTVVKIFESSTDVVGNLKYDFLNDIIPKSEQTSASAISPSLLSGPR